MAHEIVLKKGMRSEPFKLFERLGLDLKTSKSLNLKVIRIVHLI